MQKPRCNTSQRRTRTRNSAPLWFFRGSISNLCSENWSNEQWVRWEDSHALTPNLNCHRLCSDWELLELMHEHRTRTCTYRTVQFIINAQYFSRKDVRYLFELGETQHVLSSHSTKSELLAQIAPRSSHVHFIFLRVSWNLTSSPLLGGCHALVFSIKSNARHGGTAIMVQVFDFEANMNDSPFHK